MFEQMVTQHNARRKSIVTVTTLVILALVNPIFVFVQIRRAVERFRTQITLVTDVIRSICERRWRLDIFS
jgi:hypothetical protein